MISVKQKHLHEECRVFKNGFTMNFDRFDNFTTIQSCLACQTAIHNKSLLGLEQKELINSFNENIDQVKKNYVYKLIKYLRQ